MGHHIDDEGRVKSDKHPDLAPDKRVLRFKDPAARLALGYYARFCEDKELVDDIRKRLRTLDEATPEPPDD